MKIEGFSFNQIDWDKIEKTKHPGEVGTAYWKTVEQGNIRVRMVEYVPGYRSDHWCAKGHVVFVLKGSLITSLKDGTRHILSAGQSYQVSDQRDEHRSESPDGAVLLIVD